MLERGGGFLTSTFLLSGPWREIVQQREMGFVITVIANGGEREEERSFGVRIADKK